jgi:hypothetical protein
MVPHNFATCGGLTESPRALANIIARLQPALVVPTLVNVGGLEPLLTKRNAQFENEIDACT